MVENVALTAAASASNTFTNGNDLLICAIITPLNGSSTKCEAHLPKLSYGGAMIGLQTSSAEPVLFSVRQVPRTYMAAMNFQLGKAAPVPRKTHSACSHEWMLQSAYYGRSGSTSPRKAC